MPKAPAVPTVPTVPAAIYARISEHDASFDKVANQVKRCRALAKAHHADVIDVFDGDDGISAWADLGKPRKHRSDYEALVQGIMAGRYRIVIAIAPDRFQRNSLDGIMFRELCAEHGTLIVTEEGVVDPADPVSEAMATMRTAMSQLRVSEGRLKLVARLREEASAGRPLWGVRPFGYETDRLTPRSQEADAIRAAFDAILRPAPGTKPATLYAIRAAWNAATVTLPDGTTGPMTTTNGNPWDYQAVRKVLLRPRNAGIVMYRDQPQEGVQAAWEPLVSRQDYDDMVRVLTAPARRTAPGRKPSHVGSGLIFCGVCGQVMRPGSSGSAANGTRVAVYKCKTKIAGGAVGERHTAVRCDAIDPLLRREIANAFLVGPANLLGEQPPAADSGEHYQALARVGEARARILRLVRQDLVSEGQAARDLHALNGEEADIRGKIDALERAAAASTMAVDLRRGLYSNGSVALADAADTRQALEDRFDALPLDQRRDLVRRLLRVTVHPGRRPDRIAVEHLEVPGLNAER